MNDPAKQGGHAKLSDSVMIKLNEKQPIISGGRSLINLVGSSTQFQLQQTSSRLPGGQIFDAHLMYRNGRTAAAMASQRNHQSHNMLHSVTSAASSSRETNSNQLVSLTALENPQANLENSILNTNLESLIAVDQLYSHRQDVNFVRKKVKKRTSNERRTRNLLRQD